MNCPIRKFSPPSPPAPNSCSTTAKSACGSRRSRPSGTDHGAGRRPLVGRKGVNVPGAVLPISALSEKDRADLRFARSRCRLGRAVLCAAAGRRRRGAAPDRRPGGDPDQVGKPAAIDHLEELIEISDAVMVARGDLGSKCRRKWCRSCRNGSSRSAGKRQTGDRRYPDVGLHGCAPAPTGPKPRRRHRGFRFRRCGDAVGGNRGRRFRGESVAMMDRIITTVEGDSQYLARNRRRISNPRRPLPTRSPWPPASGGDHRRGLHRNINNLWIDHPTGRPRAAVGADSLHHLQRAVGAPLGNGMGGSRRPHHRGGALFGGR